MFSARPTPSIACVVLLLSVCLAGCQPKSNVADAQRVDQLNFIKLQAAHDARREEYISKLQEAGADSEAVSELSQSFSKCVLSTIDEMLKIAEFDPSAPTSLEAAKWIVRHCDSGYGPHVRAAELLLAHHPQPENLPADLYGHFDGYEPVYEHLLRRGAESNRSREAKAHATFELANLLTSRADFRNAMDATPELDPDRIKNLGASTVEQLKASSPDQDRADAQKLYDLVRRAYADIAYRDQTLGDVAGQRQLPFTQDYPEIGKQAPNIDASDLDGKRLTLESLRGRVVVVSFWASWCAACLDRVPEENDLVEEFADADFVFMGVNGDQEIKDAQRVVESKPIRFNSWWEDPQAEESIVARWGVTAWPTTFVLDKSGTIRFKNLAGPELRRAIRQLLASDQPTTQAIE